MNQLVTEARALCRDATIPGFPGYVVTDDGRVFSYVPWRGTAMRELVQEPNSHGYMRVRMNIGERRVAKRVHALVAAAFLADKPVWADQIRHLDGNKQNNRANNLAWGTALENAQDRDRHGRTARGSRNGQSKARREALDAMKENAHG